MRTLYGLYKDKLEKLRKQLLVALNFLEALSIFTVMGPYGLVLTGLGLIRLDSNLTVML